MHSHSRAAASRAPVPGMLSRTHRHPSPSRVHALLCHMYTHPAHHHFLHTHTHPQPSSMHAQPPLSQVPTCCCRHPLRAFASLVCICCPRLLQVSHIIILSHFSHSPASLACSQPLSHWPLLSCHHTCARYYAIREPIRAGVAHPDALSHAHAHGPPSPVRTPTCAVSRTTPAMAHCRVRMLVVAMTTSLLLSHCLTCIAPILAPLVLHNCPCLPPCHSHPRPPASISRAPYARPASVLCAHSRGRPSHAISRALPACLAHRAACQCTIRPMPAPAPVTFPPHSL
ncbi:hypothetical protein EVG20_g10287 [Dentipellis fragilis]|uniref:Uncharacterized protein n=1 Tax=Dentipellis fragilis TaxID=205917 RepID=A0A4Y9XWU4_9AGAM|nr:hypothetical protein EVG20_g10287 [Dentipellis fragilis]